MQEFPTIPGIDIQVVPESHVLEVVLNRAPGNRIGWQQLTGLQALFQQLKGMEASSPVRAVLVRAEGPDFSHGADLRDSELAALIAGGSADREQLAAAGQTMIEALDACPVPTVCQARGHIVGAGACIFSACDFRYAEDAWLTFPEIDRGMHLSWGILPILQREFGAAETRRLVLSGQAWAVEAIRHGTNVLRDCPDGRQAAIHLAGKPPLAVRAILQVLRTGDTSQDAASFAATVGSDDFMAAMQAWFGGDEPVFTGT